jgi:DnaJ-domain-containing protein 1
MDQMFDSLGRVIRSWINSSSDGDSPTPSAEERRRGHTGDPDLDAAWDELNEFLGDDRKYARKPEKAETDHSGRTRTGGSTRTEGSARTGGSTGNAGEQAKPSGVSDELKTDYANLGLPFGASHDKVRLAYKKLLMQYHPDRNADNPEKLRIATEITQKINISYQRIEKYLANLKD